MSIKILQVNLGRSRIAHDLLYAIACENNIDIVVISEPNKKISERYNFIMDNKKDVAIYLRNKNVGIRSHTAGNGYISIVWDNWCLFGCYFSPNISLEEFKESTDALAQDIRTVNLEAVVVGDFNSKFSMWGSPVMDGRGNGQPGWILTLLKRQGISQVLDKQKLVQKVKECFSAARTDIDPKSFVDTLTRINRDSTIVASRASRLMPYWWDADIHNKRILDLMGYPADYYIINKIKNEFSSGPDGVPCRLLCRVAPITVGPLTKLICLTTMDVFMDRTRPCGAFDLSTTATPPSTFEHPFALACTVQIMDLIRRK
ncbi:hypothetical protein QE152_g15874 [Popillia japonica]|uniref:Endonuclease/exonuclease/phosphatase domain-containing protein n=1 Tax=Popillia japonica TaxID=7064 RepID=A0AAW1L6S3_POPJA